MYWRAIPLAFLLVAVPHAASAAQLFIEPGSGSYGPGDTFVANVRVNNEGECINVADVRITYPVESLRAVDFSRGGSILTLWVQEPTLDTEQGVVSFAGGIPGGYCGRIQGDAALSNTLGKIVFTVVNAEAGAASISIDEASSVLLNDGIGTVAPLTRQGASITLLESSIGQTNPWLAEVEADTLPPDPFRIEIQSTRGVFGGKYYAVFSTVDKQSGLNHYEIFERGVWRRISSPYQLRDQTLSDVRIRAIDKAGNERLGEYEVGSAPPRQSSVVADWGLLMGALLMLILVGALKLFLDRRMRPRETPQPPTA